MKNDDLSTAFTEYNMKPGSSAYLNVLYVVAFLVTSFIFDRLGWGAYIAYLAVCVVIVRLLIYYAMKK